MTEATLDLGRLAQDLQIRRRQIENVFELLSAGMSVEFIARYRRDATGIADEDLIREISHRYRKVQELAERKQTIIRSIEAQGKLTDELKGQIDAAQSLHRVEDLFAPFRPKKPSPASAARDKGLEPLALAILARDPLTANLKEQLPNIVDPDKQLATEEDVVAGLESIIGEHLAENADLIDVARRALWAGKLRADRATMAKPTAEAALATDAPPERIPTPLSAEVESEYRPFFGFAEPAKLVPPHRLASLHRGEIARALDWYLEFNRAEVKQAIIEKLALADHPNRALLEKAADLAVGSLCESLSREILDDLRGVAKHHVIRITARAVRNLLMLAPSPGKRVLAIEPGYRLGCRCVALDEVGEVQGFATIHWLTTRKKKKSKKKDANKVGSEAKEAAIVEHEESASEESVTEESTTEVHHGDEDPPILTQDGVFRETFPDDEPIDLGSVGHTEDSSADLTASSSEPPADPTSEAATEVVEPTAVETAPAETSVAPAESSDTEIPPAEPLPPDPDKEIHARRPWLAGIVLPTPAWVGKLPVIVKAPSKPSVQNIPRRDRAKSTLAELCERHRIELIVLGKGTAFRETEELISELIAEKCPTLQYAVVSEAGAAHYANSPLAREELGNLDSALRSTVSLGRRFQNPLQEFLKIDPVQLASSAIHEETDNEELRQAIVEVMQSCSSLVGADLNTASASTLQYISGLNALRAHQIVEYRKQHGPFKSRDQLKEVTALGPVAYEMSAGFLKIEGGDVPLDGTWLHPDQYGLATIVLERVGYTPEVLRNENERPELHRRFSGLDIEKISTELEVSVGTVRDVLGELAYPGQDCRQNAPAPALRSKARQFEDLEAGTSLVGTVQNVVDFGVFVDIGLNESGLVHISQMAHRFIRNPHEVAAVGDVVNVWVLKIDGERKRVSLTMIEPGSVRPEPTARGTRPPRGRRRGPGEGDRQPNQQQGAPAQNQPMEAGQGQARGRQQRPPGDRPPGRDQQQNQQGGRDEGQRRSHHRDQGRRRPTEDRVIETSSHKKKPPVQLSQDALEGREVLHTFGELKALFEAKKQPSKKPNDDDQKRT